MKKWLYLLLIPAALAAQTNVNSTFTSAPLTATSQTSAPINLSNRSWSAGTVQLTGVGLTTATFGVLGSSDPACGSATFQPIAINLFSTPGTVATTVTATATALYQVNLAGLYCIEYQTSGTFTATSITLVLTASPNAIVGRSSGGGGGSGTVTSVSVVTANGVSGTVATATTTPAITLSLGAINPTSIGQTTPGPISGTIITSTPQCGGCAAMDSFVGGTTVPTLSTGQFNLLGPASASPDTQAWQFPAAHNASAGLAHVGAAASVGGGYVSQATVSGVAIADMTATGTPSSTTYLRGDNTWATPSGGAVQPLGNTYIVMTGPTTNTTTSGTTTGSATTINVASTTGYAAPATGVPLRLWVVNPYVSSDIVHCTSIASSTQFAGCTWGDGGFTPSSSIASGSTVYEISQLESYGDSLPYPMLRIWKGAEVHYAAQTQGCYVQLANSYMCSDVQFDGTNVTAGVVVATNLYLGAGVGGAAIFQVTYTVATLPSVSAGTVVMVTDSLTYTPGACTGGGSDRMLAIYDGSAWSCH